jgi:hypothetical protein
MLFVYTVRTKHGRVLYAGQGAQRRLGWMRWYLERNHGFHGLYVAIERRTKSRASAVAFERVLIAKFNPPFNKARWGNFGGIVPSAEHREKISAAQIGIKRGPMPRAIREKLKSTFTAERRAAISALHRGKTISPEQRAAISAYHKGRPKSAEHRAKIALAQQQRRQRERHVAG